MKGRAFGVFRNVILRSEQWEREREREGWEEVKAKETNDGLAAVPATMHFPHQGIASPKKGREPHAASNRRGSRTPRVLLPPLLSQLGLADTEKTIYQRLVNTQITTIFYHAINGGERNGIF